MQFAIGDHALLSDGRTAALVDPSGNVAWLCWPRIDSQPLLMHMLDTHRGGIFTLRPTHPDASVVSRRYHQRSLVLETVWAAGPSRAVVDDALVLDGPPRLVRRVRCQGPPVDFEARFSPAAHNPTPVELSSPGDSWQSNDGVIVTRFIAGEHAQSVTLGEGQAQPADDPISATIARWQTRVPDMTRARIARVAHGEQESSLRELLATSACVLLGLRQRDGGIVAAPTTSLPQWPGTGRTWDYRYCWTRDAALAATALLRLGLTDAAHDLAVFLSDVLQRGEPPALVRVDGSAPPAERELDLEGYRGARPVRIGNAAAHQLQVDIAGEVTQLAIALAAHDALPESLAAVCPRIATWAAEHWDEPDHGIWEIRGSARHYTHSRVMAWTALRDASELVETRRAAGDVTGWRRAMHGIRERVMGRAGGALQLTATGGGPDSALSCVPLVGFLAGQHPVTRATLRAIENGLDRNGLLDRCLPEEEYSTEPCGAFLFPTFWMASALERAGLSGERHFTAALACRGALGLFGEVADPQTRAPLGNFPQVQSQASFVLAATAE